MDALSRRRNRITVLTPHEGEFVRAGGDLSQGRERAAADFAREHGVYLVLKGPGTIAAAPDAVSYTHLHVDVKNIQKDKIYTVTYNPAEVEFTVKHYWQNLNDDEYIFASESIARAMVSICFCPCEMFIPSSLMMVS